MKKIIVAVLLGLSLSGCNSLFSDPFKVELFEEMNPQLMYSDNAEPIISKIQMTVQVQEVVLSGVFVNDGACELTDWKPSGYTLNEGDVFTVYSSCDPSTVKTVKLYTNDGDHEYTF